MSDTFKPVQAPKLFLAGSGTTSTATSVQVTNLYKPGTTTNIAMSDFGSIGYGVFEPGTEREENFSFTGITTAADDKATFTGVTRGLDFVDPYAETSALKHAHAGGSECYISNTAPFYSELGAKDNDESVTGVWTYSASAIPRLGSAGTYGVGTEEFLTTKRYVDSLSVAGAPDATTTQKGVVELATQAQSDAGTSAGDSTTASLVSTPDLTAKSVQKGAWTYAADAGSSDTYAIALAVAPAAYAAGLELTFKANTANTGAATLNVNSLGAKAIKKFCNGAISDLENNDIVAGLPVRVSYDGTQFIMLSDKATALDSAVSYESQQFFSTTDITGAEAQTLTGGAASDASALHFHPEINNFTMLDTGTTFDQTFGTKHATFTPDGSYMFVAKDSGSSPNRAIQIFRFAKDSYSGNYYYDGVTATLYENALSEVGDETFGMWAGATYLWIAVRDTGGSALLVWRFTHALAGKTGMTLAGTAHTTGTSGACGDDTKFWIQDRDAATDTDMKYFTISGTTATYVSTAAHTDQAQNKAGYWYDGTHIYNYVTSSGNRIRKSQTDGTSVSLSYVAPITTNAIVDGFAIGLGNDGTSTTTMRQVFAIDRSMTYVWAMVYRTAKT